jgi:hypothetical protein
MRAVLILLSFLCPMRCLENLEIFSGDGGEQDIRDCEGARCLL